MFKKSILFHTSILTSSAGENHPVWWNMCNKIQLSYNQSYRYPALQNWGQPPLIAFYLSQCILKHYHRKIWSSGIHYFSESEKYISLLVITHCYCYNRSWNIFLWSLVIDMLLCEVCASTTWASSYTISRFYKVNSAPHISEHLSSQSKVES